MEVGGFCFTKRSKRKKCCQGGGRSEVYSWGNGDYNNGANTHHSNVNEEDNDNIASLSDDSSEDTENVNELAKISADENSHNTTQSPQINQNI